MQGRYLIVQFISLNRAWSGNTSWNGDESSVSAEYKQLIQNWKDGNYPIGGIPQIDEDGIADLSGMAEKGILPWQPNVNSMKVVIICGRFLQQID